MSWFCFCIWILNITSSLNNEFVNNGNFAILVSSLFPTTIEYFFIVCNRTFCGPFNGSSQDSLSQCVSKMFLCKNSFVYTGCLVNHKQKLNLLFETEQYIIAFLGPNWNWRTLFTIGFDMGMCFSRFKTRNSWNWDILNQKKIWDGRKNIRFHFCFRPCNSNII